jgi:sugar transferase (PEP-CTERM/EpsH1 system associated)
MNIFYICHRIPYPPNKGDKIRSFHQIKHLSKRHTVHLACLIDERDDLEHINILKKYCSSIDSEFRDKSTARFLAIFSIFSRKPLSVAAFYSKKLKKKITQRLNTEKFDRIIVFSSGMAEYVKNITHIPKIIDFVDVDSDKWKLYASYQPFPFSQIYQLEAKRLALYEEVVAKVFDHSIFVSEKEATLFRQRVKNIPISVISNGVDIEYFSPNGDGFHPNEPGIVFTGAMDYFPNIDAVRYFCSEIFPLVRKIIPEVIFYIVGRNPTRQVKALGRLPNIIVTGSVSDVRPYLLKGCVSVAPFRIARGIQNKVLEAMSIGLPVVGTSNAFQGIKATESNGIRIVDKPEAFAEEIIALMSDPGLRHHCSLEARSYVRQYHQWKDQGIILESLLQEMD